MTRYVVLLDPAATPASIECIYGPFDTRELAERYAQFLTGTVDPASVHEMRDPTIELLAWWDHSRNGWPTLFAIETRTSEPDKDAGAPSLVLCPNCPDWAMEIISSTDAATMFKCSRCGHETVVGACGRGRCGYLVGHAPGCLPPHPGINITTTASDDEERL